MIFFIAPEGFPVSWKARGLRPRAMQIHIGSDLRPYLVSSDHADAPSRPSGAFLSWCPPANKCAVGIRKLLCNGQPPLCLMPNYPRRPARKVDAGAWRQAFSGPIAHRPLLPSAYVAVDAAALVDRRMIADLPPAPAELSVKHSWKKDFKKKRFLLLLAAASAGCQWHKYLAAYS